MPIYEFQCKDCGTVFAKLVIKKDTKRKIECTVCKSTNVEKKISTISNISSVCGSSSSGFK